MAFWAPEIIVLPLQPDAAFCCLKCPNNLLGSVLKDGDGEATFVLTVMTARPQLFYLCITTLVSVTQELPVQFSRMQIFCFVTQYSLLQFFSGAYWWLWEGSGRTALEWCGGGSQAPWLCFLWPILKSDYLFSYCRVLKVLFIFWITPFQMCLLQIFCFSLWLVFCKAEVLSFNEA